MGHSSEQDIHFCSQLRGMMSTLILRLAEGQSSMMASRLTRGPSMTQMLILDVRSQWKLTSSSPIPRFQVSRPLSAKHTLVHSVIKTQTWGQYSFPLAAVMHYYKHRGLEYTNVLSCRSGGQNSKTGCQGCIPSGRSRENPFPSLYVAC